MATIVASYAAGAVQGGSGNLAEFGCLVGRNSFGGIPPVSGTITNSYWDSAACTRGTGQAGERLH